MSELVRSRQAMVFASLAAVIWALANALVVTAYATYSGLGDAQTFRNLAIANAWLHFGSALVALSAVSFVAWTLYLSHQSRQMWESLGLPCQH